MCLGCIRYMRTRKRLREAEEQAKGKVESYATTSALSLSRRVLIGLQYRS